MNKTYFCPRCHHPVRPAIKGEFSGNITVICPNCGKGKVVIKGKPIPEQNGS
jgi:DNA-directed RNA polymerase subunit RPC12/RpoP